MPTILDHLADAATTDGRFVFLPDNVEVSTAALWRRAHEIGGGVAQVVDDGAAALGALLTSTPDCLATIAGTWLVGRRLVSLPLPARGQPAKEYASMVARMCRLAGVAAIAADDAHLPLLGAFVDIPVVPFRSLARDPSLCVAQGGGDLVQFTSGSTSEPKGVVVSLESIAAQCTTLAEASESERGVVSCSWLPLSHDMGLIGMCLAPWAASSPNVAGDVTGVLIDPEAFVSRPGRWMQALSDHRAVITASPNFGLEVATRMLRRAAGRLDLSSLRVLIVGAERVQAKTLRAFTEAAGGTGFDPTAIAPSYGLAEATLGVTMTRPGEHWTAVGCDPLELAAGRVVEADGGTELVACGTPLPGAAVSLARQHPRDDVGEIAFSSTSALERYIGGELRRTVDGMVLTNDLGCIRDGHLLPAGRRDDMLIVRGRNLYAHDLEAVVESVPGVRKHSVAAIDDGAGGYAVVLETTAGGATAAKDVRAALAAAHGAAPSEVVVVGRGMLAKTPSGKVQRNRIAAQYVADELVTNATHA